MKRYFIMVLICSMILSSLNIVPLAALAAGRLMEEEQPKGVIPNAPRAFINVQEAIKLGQDGLAALLREGPPPPPGEDPEAWQRYFSDYVNYINTLTDPSAKAAAWKTLLDSLKNMLSSRSDLITGEAIKTVMSAAKQFLGSEDFKKLNSSEKTDFVIGLIGTLETAISNSKEIDTSTVADTLSGIYAFFGSNGWSFGENFAGLDKNQKLSLMQAFVSLVKTIMQTNSAAIDSSIRAGAAVNIVRALTVNLREQYRNSDYNVDFSQIKRDVVNLIANFVNSEEFKTLSDGQKIDLIGNFTVLAVELVWRPEDNAANRELLSQITGVFKTALEVGSTTVKAAAINNLTHLFRIASWRNGDVANQILTALNVTGGVGALIQDLLSGVSDGALDPNARGDIAIALANLIMHRNDVERVTGQTIGTEMTAQMVTKVTEFIRGINNGSVTVGWWIRNGLMHIAGGAIAGMINEGTQNTDLNRAFVNEYLKMAEDSLLLPDTEGGNISLQTTVINVLTYLRGIAANKNDASLADRMKNVLLNENFDLQAFINNARELLSTLVGINADVGAWFAAALTNIAQLHLSENTGKIDADTLKSIAISIKSWVTDPNNLKDMRWMWLQSWLFESIGKLTKELAAITDDKELEDVLVDIFKAIPNLDDPKAKEIATEAIAGDLVKYLRDNGYTDLATRISEIFVDNGPTLPPGWNNWSAQQRGDWLKAELLSQDAARIKNALAAFASLSTQDQAAIIGILIPAHNPDPNSDGYKVMNQLFQGLKYDQQSALIKTLSKDTYYPTAAVHLLANVDAETRNKLFVDLARTDALAASRILAHWPEGKNPGSMIYDMFKAVLDDNVRVAYNILRNLDSDPVRAYFADALREHFKLPDIPPASAALLQHDGAFFANGWLTFGIYYRDANGQIVRVQLFDSSGRQIMSLQDAIDSIPVDAEVGYYLENSNSRDVWYSDASLNSDGFNHFRVEQTANGIVVRIEDLRGGGDQDFNDYVVQINNVIQPGDDPRLPPVTATLLQHNGDFFNNGWLTFGVYYRDPASGQIVRIQLFDSKGNQLRSLQDIIKSLPEGAVMGYYLENSNSRDIWYSDSSLNSDGYNHFRIEQTANGIVIRIEDLRGGGDQDFDDYVVQINNTLVDVPAPGPIPGPEPIPEPIPDPMPTPMPIPDPITIQPRMIDLVYRDLANRFGIDISKIKLVNVQYVEWADASLGAPEPGMMYAQVITPGFKITLSVDDKTYVYHTDLNNKVILALMEEPAYFDLLTH